MEPTQEQIKEFWEWCGFQESRDRVGWWYPAGLAKVLELPPIDFNNLFKWAVPKVELPNYRLGEIRFYPHWQGTDNYLCEFTLEQREPDRYSPEACKVEAEQGGTPTLALFWAIYKLIGDKG